MNNYVNFIVIILSLEDLVDSTLMWDLPPRRRFDPFDKNFVPRLPVYEPLNIQNVHHTYHDYHHIQQSPNYPPPNPPQPPISPPSQWKIGSIFQKGIEGLTSSAASFLPQTLSSITPQIHRPPRPPTEPTTSQSQQQLQQQQQQQEPSKHASFFSSLYNNLKPTETPTTTLFQVGQIENHEEIPSASSSHFNYPSINYHPNQQIPMSLIDPYYSKREEYPKRDEKNKEKKKVKKGQYTEQRRKEPQNEFVYMPAQYSPDVEGEDEITWAEFLRAVTSSPNGPAKRNNYPSPTRKQWRCFVEGARPKGGIRSKEEAAMALAQILFESNGLTNKKEEICNKAISLANCDKQSKKKLVDKDCDAPGKKYYGRGYLNLRGCANYRAASVDLYNSERLVWDPDVLTRDEDASWDVALWQWRTKIRVSKGVVDEGHFGATTAAIVGSSGCKSRAEQGPRKRYKIYGIVRNAFGLSGKGNEEGCFKPYSKTKKKPKKIFPDF